MIDLVVQSLKWRERKSQNARRVFDSLQKQELFIFEVESKVKATANEFRCMTVGYDGVIRERSKIDFCVFGRSWLFDWLVTFINH